MTEVSRIDDRARVAVVSVGLLPQHGLVELLFAVALDVAAEVGLQIHVDAEDLARERRKWWIDDLRNDTSPRGLRSANGL